MEIYKGRVKIWYKVTARYRCSAFKEYKTEKNNQYDYNFIDFVESNGPLSIHKNIETCRAKSECCLISQRRNWQLKPASTAKIYILQKHKKEIEARVAAPNNVKWTQGVVPMLTESHPEKFSLCVGRPDIMASNTTTTFTSVDVSK